MQAACSMAPLSSSALACAAGVLHRLPRHCCSSVRSLQPSCHGLKQPHEQRLLPRIEKQLHCLCHRRHVAAINSRHDGRGQQGRCLRRLPAGGGCHMPAGLCRAAQVIP